MGFNPCCNRHFVFIPHCSGFLGINTHINNWMVIMSINCAALDISCNPGFNRELGMDANSGSIESS